MPKIRHPERMPRSVRKAQIVEYMRRSLARDPGHTASRADIARMLKVGKSTHLTDMLFELVEEGHLKAFPCRWINGWPMWLFAHADSPYEQVELYSDHAN